MALYFYDIESGEETTRGTEGVEFADREKARRAAIMALLEIAAGELPNGDRQTFRVVMRDDAGRAVFEARLDFRSTSL